jgi:hypothetical protein
MAWVKQYMEIVYTTPKAMLKNGCSENVAIVSWWIQTWDTGKNFEYPSQRYEDGSASEYPRQERRPMDLSTDRQIFDYNFLDESIRSHEPSRSNPGR